MVPLLRVRWSRSFGACRIEAGGFRGTRPAAAAQAPGEHGARGGGVCPAGRRVRLRDSVSRDPERGPARCAQAPGRVVGYVEEQLAERGRPRCAPAAGEAVEQCCCRLRKRGCLDAGEREERGGWPGGVGPLGREILGRGPQPREQAAREFLGRGRARGTAGGERRRRTREQLDPVRGRRAPPQAHREGGGLGLGRERTVGDRRRGPSRRDLYVQDDRVSPRWGRVPHRGRESTDPEKPRIGEAVRSAPPGRLSVR